MEVSHSSFCSDRPRPPGFSMFPAGSSDSLDISHLIPCNTHDSETLLSTALSVASIESAYSLTDVPSFRVAAAPHRKLHIKYRPILITNDPLNPTSPARSRVTVTVPTPPRLRTMLMEPICISHWNTYLSPQAPPGHSPWYDEIENPGIAPPWVPQGSIFPPEAFQTILRHKRLAQSGHPVVPERNRTCEVSERHHREVETEESLPPPTEACHPIPTLVTEARRTFSNMSLHTGLNLPTITISNSSAMFSVSSTSSQNLCPSVPLAIRRGNKLPAPLFLSQAGHNPPGHENELGLYPGIPTPFRGSPSMSTPVFQLAHDSYVSTMDVRSMCEDLRSRCPPLRPDTPTNIITNASEIISDVISDTSDESEEDEWAFAAGLLTKSSETPDKSRDAIAESTADSDILPPEPCPNELGDLDTSRPSWANAEGLADARDEGRSALPDRTAGLTPKQQRRKTVIIETPDSSLRRRNRMTLDLSHLTDDHHDGDDDNNETRGQYAIPFETPSSAANFSPDGFSSSTPSRPASSATMRPPVKGILKGRKSVRFSVLPSMHEYPLEEPHLVEQPASPSPKVSLSLPSKSQGSGPYSSKVKLGSPLRQTFVAKSPSPKVSPRGYRSTFPKHPAVRAIIKDSSSNSSTASSSSPPSSPTTARRLPLRIKNDRQSLPTRLSTPSPLGPSKARKTIGLEDIGSPRRLKTAISRKPSSNRVSSAENENSARRDSATSVLQKTCSRSSLRSIFTKLRA